jgi:hypothetical protein
MILGWVAIASLVTLGVISCMIKDNDFDEWDKNKEK